jgi:hypothetical protein
MTGKCIFISLILLSALIVTLPVDDTNTQNDARLIEEVFTLKRPEDIAFALRTMEEEIVLTGGEFSGNTTGGTFHQGVFYGVYTVTQDSFIITIRRPVHESAVQKTVSNTKAVGGGFNFSFNRPQDIPAAVNTVKGAIEKNGGNFSGNESAGSFKASGIAGDYKVGSLVSVTISEKPFFIPNTMIEKEVKNYFGVK